MKDRNSHRFLKSNYGVILIGILTLNCGSPNKNTSQVGMGKEIEVETVSDDLEISTSNKELVAAFNWAKTKARSFVQTGKMGPINISERNAESEEVAYIPSYWAGYPGRSAFYSRDYCHQLVGAHLLGLTTENFAMMKAFAGSADANKKWYPLWAINFDGSPFVLDYRGDDDFVREVPAVFELVEKAYDLYQWTGDDKYFKDAELWNYYTMAVTDFVSLHDNIIPNGVAEGTGRGIFKGTATYNEHIDQPLIEAGDGIASQYKAFDAYSKMAAIRGELEVAQEFEEKARTLKAYFNGDWGIKGTQIYNRGYLEDGTPIAGWGKENSWFMPMKGIVDAGTLRTNNYLDFIEERLDTKDDMPNNIEALSYVPEVFFQYHRNESGWKWMNHIISHLQQEHITSGLTGTNGDYPEVSYVLIKNVVEDLMGIIPNAEKNEVVTFSHLPGAIDYLEVRNVRMGTTSISVKHDGQHTSKLQFQNGEGALIWQARFPGIHNSLFINGIEKPCHQGKDHGVEYSYYDMELKKGDSLVVSIRP